MSQAARAATTEEKALLRTPGDWTKAYLAIYKPNVIYTAILSSVPASTDMVGHISYTSGSGTLANVKAEMTLWVGSTAGARDIGICRIRKAPISGTFFIGYTSEIDWSEAGTVYLTIVDHAMLSKKPVLISDGDVLMDGEHSFSDQHIDFDPVPVMSCHAVGSLDGGSVSFQWDASNSWVFDSTVTAYLWSAPGSAAISSTTSATPTITYNSAGNHPVYCTVTAANGKSATGIQFAFRFDLDYKPYVVDVQAPGADYDTGGWSYNVKMHSDADPTNFIEGALAVLFAEDYYGATKQSIGQLANRENIICWGYISDESIEWDAEISTVEFSVEGPHYFLKQISASPIALTMANNTPDQWSVMPGLTVDRALWHILHWRSNATALLNITLTGDSRYAPKIESMDGSLWSQMSEVAFRKIVGRIGCDRYGRFFAVIEPQCVPVADRTWASVMTLTKKDWRNSVGIDRKTKRELSMLSTSGWVVDSSTSVTTLYSLAMGHIDAQYGGSEIIDQLLVVDQSQINELTGLYMGWKNKELEFNFSLSQNNRMVDLWPNQYLDVSLAAEDTPRGISYTGNLVPRSITLQPDPEAGCWSTEISCEAETFTELAVIGDIPAESGIDSFDSSFPGADGFPTLEEIPLIDTYPSVENLNYPNTVVILSSNFGVMYSENVDNGDPNKIVWKAMNSGLMDIDWADARNLLITPSGAVFVQTSANVFAASGLGGTFRSIADASNFNNGIILGIGLNPHQSEEIAIIGSKTVYDGTAKGRLVLADSSGLGVQVDTMRLNESYQGSVVYAAGQWHVFGAGNFVFTSPIVWHFSASGAPLSGISGDYFPGSDASEHFSAVFGTQDRIVIWAGSFGQIATAGATVFTYMPGSPQFRYRQAIAPSPTGIYAFGGVSTFGGELPSLSTDSGVSWTPTGLTVGPTVYENCNDDNRWLYGGGANIRLTLDRGATSYNLFGSLIYSAPLINIKNIRFVK